MRYVAAYMLAILGGKDDPTADDIRGIIESVGVEVDEEKMNILLQKLNGKNITEVQEAGVARLATIPSMGREPEKTIQREPVTDESEKSKDSKAPHDHDDDDDDDDEDGIGIMNIFG